MACMLAWRRSKHGGKDVFASQIRPRMEAIAVATLQSVAASITRVQVQCQRRWREGRCNDSLVSMAPSPQAGFEWLGFDFLVDEQLDVHLLEVNVSPDITHATSVLRELVPKAHVALLPSTAIVGFLLSPTPADIDVVIVVVCCGGISCAAK